MDVRRRGRHLDLGRHPQVRLRPEGHVAAAAPHAGGAGGRSTSRSPTGRATRCSTRRCSRPSRAGRWPARGRSSRRSATRATSGSPPTRSARSTASARASRRSTGCRCSSPRTPPWSRSSTDGSCDAFTVCDEMAARGWFVQPQMSYAGTPPTIHLSVSAATAAHVDDLLDALAASVGAAVDAGPVAVDAGVVAFIEALDPAALSDADFDGLLAASGLVGESTGGRPRPARPAGRGQRPARRRLAPDARGAAGGVPRPTGPPRARDPPAEGERHAPLAASPPGRGGGARAAGGRRRGRLPAVRAPARPARRRRARHAHRRRRRRQLGARRTDRHPRPGRRPRRGGGRPGRVGIRSRGGLRHRRPRGGHLGGEPRLLLAVRADRRPARRPVRDERRGHRRPRSRSAAGSPGPATGRRTP